MRFLTSPGDPAGRGLLAGRAGAVAAGGGQRRGGGRANF